MHSFLRNDEPILYSWALGDIVHDAGSHRTPLELLSVAFYLSSQGHAKLSVPFHTKHLEFLLLWRRFGGVGVLQIYSRVTGDIQVEVFVLEVGVASTFRQLDVDVALAQWPSNL